MNAIKFAVVFTIIETALVFYINEIEEEHCQKFHDEYLLAILEIMLKINKMARRAIMIGGTLINATVFVGGSSLAKYLSGDQNSVEEEKKIHDLAVEKYQAAYEKYQENRIKLSDWIATNDRVKEQAKQDFSMQTML